MELDQFLNHAWNFHAFLAALDKKESFAFSRWGDGEWNSMFNPLNTQGKTGQNCDGHKYFPDMAKELKRVLLDSPDYYLGMQNLGLSIHHKEIIDLLGDKKERIKWIDADMLHRASIRGKMGHIFAGYQKNNVVMVGPPHLRPMNKYFGYADFIEVDRNNCWLRYDGLLQKVTNTLSLYSKPLVVSISASMPAKILIHDLWKKFKGVHMLVDAGSMFDPYCGVQSRGYHKKLEI